MQKNLKISFMNIDEFKQPNHVILHTIMLIITCVCFLFSFINFLEERYFLSILQAIVCFVNLMSLVNFKKIIQSAFASKFIIGYSCLILVVLAIVIFAGNKNNLTYLWIFL
ncbi:MAG: hypothetical protein KGV51_04660, partial [Moraxellaceae bacterium]|nr:hypothetical protein [Moraxellaceae bacterium]